MFIRYNSADDGIDKFVAFATFFRSDLDRHFAELSRAARLFSMTITRICIPANRLAEWNARLDHFDIYFIPLLQALHHNIKLQFALPLNQDLIKFGIMHDNECR